MIIHLTSYMDDVFAQKPLQLTQKCKMHNKTD